MDFQGIEFLFSNSTGLSSFVRTLNYPGSMHRLFAKRKKQEALPSRLSFQFRLAKSLWNQGDPEVTRRSLITSRRRAIARNVDVFLIFLQVVRPKTPISYSELSLSVHPQRDLSLGQTRMSEFDA
jgi:hypothetical protein